MLFSTTVVAKAFRRRKEDTFLEDLRGVCANAKTTLQSKSVWLSLKLRGQMLSNRLGLRSVRNFLPIHRVVQKIGVKFGSSVLGYYRLASWVIHFNIILFFCLWLPLVIVPWFDFWQERNWTDPAGNDVLVWDEVLLNFIAVNDGNRTTDRTWFFYSGYPPAYDDYEVAGMYVVLCIATYASALIALTVTIGRNILDSATPVGDMQLPVALFAWDWGVTSPQAVDEKMLGAWTGLQAEYYSSLRRADFFVGQKVEARPDGGGAWRRGCVVEIRVREGYFVELVEDRSVLNVTCDDNLMPVLICGMYPQTIRRCGFFS
ncbi:hypothetical protein DIPPA_24703 [Diplonema papillatum]|nr:hypothetical protein DIPPA_24703 [Diplonema papillatum]